MRCHLIKTTKEHYIIKPADHDFLEEYSVEIDVEESVLDSLLETQHNYRTLQKQLKELDNAEKLSQ